MTAAHRKMRIQINDRYTSSDRVSIGKSIIQFIRDRSEKGVGVDGTANSQGLYTTNKQFPGYTKEYIDSDKFKRSAKNPFNVNLKLKDKMLKKMKILNHGSGFIEIGFEAGTKDNAKAEGNIIGSYGGFENPSKARNFLGITEQDLNGILLSFPLPDDPRLSALGLLGVAFIVSDQTEEDNIENFDIDLFEG